MIKVYVRRYITFIRTVCDTFILTGSWALIDNGTYSVPLFTSYMNSSVYAEIISNGPNTIPSSESTFLDGAELWSQAHGFIVVPLSLTLSILTHHPLLLYKYLSLSTFTRYADHRNCAPMLWCRVGRESYQKR